MSGAPDEFALIADLFAPLARTYPGALGLTDDAALMDVPAGQQLVLTADALVAGVHFFADDPPELIARKLIRVNLSDLAAKGARPVAVMMTAAFPADIPASWLRTFAAGLEQDLREFGIALIGGDTVSTPGPLTLSLTAFGQLPAGQALLRAGARDGDQIWVSGTLGDAALGLAAKLGRLSGISADRIDELVERYLLPRPRVGLGQALRGVATAAMDISDGLVQDLGHLARQSGLGAEIVVVDLPLSDAAKLALAADDSRLASILGGGDDYEIVFTAPPSHEIQIRQLAETQAVALTVIGRMTAGQGVRVLGRDGKAVAVARGGWRHFSDTGDGR